MIIADLALRPEAEELLKRYTSQPRAVFQKTDVTDWRQLESIFAIAAKEFDTIDIVCPGAGIYDVRIAKNLHLGQFLANLCFVASVDELLASSWEPQITGCTR